MHTTTGRFFLAIAVSLYAHLGMVACNGPETAKDPASLAVSKQHLAGEYNKGTDDGPGYHGEGGPVDGPGVYGIGGGDGPGMVGVGAGFDGSGIVGQGSGHGSGGIFAGGANGPGVYAYAGTASTATDRRAAIVANGGHLEFQNVVPEVHSAPVANIVIPSNVAKAWGYIATDGAGSIGVIDGLNTASVELRPYSMARYTFAHPMESNAYACLLTAPGGDVAFISAQDASGFDFGALSIETSERVPLATRRVWFSAICFGRQ